MPTTKCGHCGAECHISEKLADEGAEVYCGEACATAKSGDPKYPPGSLVYAPCGDCDGECIGTDHFVTTADGNDEVACAPNEELGRLFAASPDMLGLLEDIAEFLSVGRAQLSASALITASDRPLIEDIRAVLAKAKGK